MRRRLCAIAAVLVACAPPASSLSPGADTGQADDSRLGAGAFAWIEPSTLLPTVATVRWRTPSAVQGLVRLREVGHEVWTVVEEATPRREHTQILRGLAADTAYDVQVEPDVVGGAPSLALSMVTGALPSWVPLAHTEGLEPHRGPEGFLVGPLADESPDTVPAILDSEGRVVWYRDDAGPVTRVRLALDRQAVVVLQHASVVNQDGRIQWLSWEGEILQEQVIQGIHTDFTLMPGGGVAVLGREVRELTPGRTFLGETIVELDASGEGGVVWSVLDAWPPDLGLIHPPCAEAPGAECYAHVNSISYDETEDRFLLTASHLGMVLNVDRDSGDVRWVLGGPHGGFVVPDVEKPFAYPHSVQAVAGGVLVYDNWNPLLGGCSGAVEFALDFDLGQATPTWSYAPEECVVNYFLGNAQRLWDGRTLVVVPAGGLIDRVDAEGVMDQLISTEEGVFLRFAQAVQSLYP